MAFIEKTVPSNYKLENLRKESGGTFVQDGKHIKKYWYYLGDNVNAVGYTTEEYTPQVVLSKHISVDLVAELRDFCLAQNNGAQLLIQYKGKVSEWIQNDFFLFSIFSRSRIQIGKPEIDLLASIIEVDKTVDGNPIKGELELITLLEGFCTYLRSKVQSN